VAGIEKLTAALFSGVAGSPQEKSARLLNELPVRCRLWPSPSSGVGVPVGVAAAG
jgi:hypothetical protein